MQLQWENMRNGIDNQADLLTLAPKELYSNVANVLDGSAPTRIYLVGCGDSHYCGLAARLAIEEYTGIPVEPLQALEFSRYAVRTAPKDSLVVAVSNSGEVARTVECLKFARQKGLRTLGITYKPDSRLAQAADQIVQYDYRDVGFGPGTMSYLASLLALYTIGIRVGFLAGRLDESGVQAELDRIVSLAPALRSTIKAVEAPTFQIGSTLGSEDELFFVGGGPNYGTAHFAMAKMIESAQLNCVAQELEEWAHEQYFCCNPGTYTVVFAPNGASVDRAREQLQAIRDVGGTAIAVCNEDDTETAALADTVLPVSGGPDEMLSPILYCAPAELLAYHFAVKEQKVMLGFNDQNRKEVNFRQIFESSIPENIPPLR